MKPLNQQKNLKTFMDTKPLREKSENVFEHKQFTQNNWTPFLSQNTKTKIYTREIYSEILNAIKVNNFIAHKVENVSWEQNVQLEFKFFNNILI